MSKDIVVEIDGSKLNSTQDKNLYELINENKIAIKSSCGGYGQCGDCIVKIEDGAEHLPSLSLEETQLLGNVFFITKERLSCRINQISGDLKISIVNKK